MRWTILGLILSGCCGTTKPPPPLTVTTVRVGCIVDPAPQPEPLELAGPEQGCPAEFEFCASPDAALKIEDYLRKARRWMEQAELGCADPTEGTP